MKENKKLDQAHGQNIVFLEANGFYNTSKPLPTMKVEQLICQFVKITCSDTTGNGTFLECKKQEAMIINEDCICVCVISINAIITNHTR